MKKNSSTRPIKYNSFDYKSYIHHGIFLSDSHVKKIDPKRLRRKHKDRITDEMYSFMSKRNTKYYFPKKNRRNDYIINIIKDSLGTLDYFWKTEYKELLDNIDNPRKRYEECIKDPASTPMMNQEERIAHCKGLYNERRKEYVILVNCFLAQNVLYIASMLEAILQQALSEKKIYRDRFNRFELYKIYNERTQNKCEDMENFIKHDRFMSLYKYIKHSSESNYNYLKSNYPELLIEKDRITDEMAENYLATLKVDSNTLSILISDLILFFEEFVEKAFGESCWEAKWNYGNYFKELVEDSFREKGFFG